MLTMAIQPNMVPTLNLKPLTFPSLRPIKASLFTNPKPFSSSHLLKATPTSFRLSASAAVAEDAPSSESPPPPPPLPQTEKLGVVVKPTEKPRLVLKFIWMEKNIGIALDQMIPGHGTIPLSPYYFWPRKDAWEELKELLESKPWISQKQMIILLNQATDIINLWQQSGGNLS
ncbi:small ribosomal subunit protein cS23-like [Gastrolobium bilobum]|uniref:small ribosomal subunit protein cS23-like n=1 Tax=Gastrolobium bilobum TaxID=150636 RepID=UPI002AB10D1A|nr:small ribosomal subunit protein cS23-like [Gastrolobium bilobum]XP_061348555.1 small ribosomal subunit protein cS23-like [Gastrolobium bilobum]XP_061348564.1 small ribosomal subunit protein cS23-like [Gastrolobium bilobum]